MKDGVKIASEESVTISRSEYERLLSENEFFKQQLAELKRLIFGSKSEKFIPSDTGQMGLFGQEPSAEQPSPTEVAPHQRKKEIKKKPVRALLPSHLPRVEEIIEPENKAPGAKKIGEEVTEILEYNPSKIFVRRIVRPKYEKISGEGVAIADLPTLPIPKGNAGPGLLAHILISKFVDHLPFYRQINILKRQKVTIQSSTMNGWFNAACDLLEPLYDTLEKKVMLSDYLQADESPIRVQDGHKENATHRGYHWLYHAPEKKLVLFKYNPGRGREGPQAVLKEFTGTLQTDGYTVYDKLRTNGDIKLAACMAHTRRKFEKALDNDKARAEHMLSLFQKLYAVERTARESYMDSTARKELRDKEAKPVIEEIERWLVANTGKVTPKSAIGQAVSYTSTLWPRLKTYLEDGRLEIDNNLIENQVRPLALGRKNYLFAGSHAAAQRAAVVYSLLGTCKLNNVEPFEWLNRTLQVIPDYKANRLEELLPGYEEV